MKKTAETIGDELSKAGKTVFLQVIDNVMRGADHVDPDSLNAQLRVLESLKKKARIFIMMSYVIENLRFMISAREVGMLNGEYAFACLWDNITPSHPAFHGVIGIATRKPSSPEFTEFLYKVLDAFDDPRFDGFPHIGRDTDVKTIHVYAGILQC